MRRFTLLALFLGAACSSSSSDGKLFIALDGDFAPFLTWESVPIPAQNLGAGHPNGPSTAYINKRAPGAKNIPSAPCW